MLLRALSPRPMRAPQLSAPALAFAFVSPSVQGGSALAEEIFLCRFLMNVNENPCDLAKTFLHRCFLPNLISILASAKMVEGIHELHI